jgi:SAM-dependent methyltransferase
MRSLLKRKTPSSVLFFLHKAGIIKKYPVVGKIRRGDFNQTTPFSRHFGFDRGGAIDRYYIENFLKKNAMSIKGRVLEIGDNEYTISFGGQNVKQSDILHVEDDNPKATFVGDLTNAPQLPDNAFDCIILTQTLHLIYRYEDALRTCYRILKPGGVLLLTVPGISHIDQGEWKKYWLWSFTQASTEKMLSETFPSARVELETFGNVFVATAFLYGMGLSEVTKEELDDHDPHFQVIITAKATKPAA